MIQYNKNAISSNLGDTNSSPKFLSKENILQNNKLINVFKNFNKNYVLYTQDKKQLQKIIMKNYISFIKKIDDSKFYNLGFRLCVNDLEKVILFVRYNETLNPSDIIKKIKKLDTLSLIDIIVLEQEFIENYTFFSNINIESYIYNDVNITKDDIDEFLDQNLILLETVKMIKAIKFDYCISSTAYFDKNNKPKKVFETKKICTLANTYYVVNNENLTLEEFANLMDVSDKYSTIDSLSDDFSNYTMIIELKSTTYSNDYSKLILGDKYNSYILNPINKFNEIVLIPLRTYYLTHRKVLLPKNGVLLLIKNENSFVESILLKEIYKFDMNHIIVITKYKDGKEIINTIPLKEDILDIIHFYKYEKEDYEGSYISIDYIFDFFQTGGNESNNNLNYEVLSPTYWKYRNRDYKSENDTLNDRGMIIKREFEIEIAPFLRKINGQPSNEAIQLSKKLGIILEEGYTIVKPHTRTYNSQK